MDPEVQNVPSVVLGSVVGWIPDILNSIFDRDGGYSQPTPTLKIPAKEAEVAIDWGSVFSGAIDIAQGQMIGGQAYAAPTQFVGGPTVLPMVASPTGGGGGVIVPPTGGGGMCAAPGECGQPRYLTFDCRTGTFSKKRRRRRGRLLTASDQHDLGVIVAMFGKGAAGQIALAAAVKR